MPDISRRQFIAATGVTAASIWLIAETRDVIAAGVHASQAKRFEVLSDADAADIEAAAAQIIPSDGTPGAREARVVYFIDKSLATFAKDQRPIVRKGREGIANARGQGAARRQIVRRADQRTANRRAHRDGEGQGRRSSTRFAASTIAGMLANPEYGGNYNKAGWTMARLQRSVLVGRHPSAGTIAMSDHTHPALAPLQQTHGSLPSRRRSRFRRRRIGRGRRRRRQGALDRGIPRRRARAGAVAHREGLRPRRDQDLPAELADERLAANRRTRFARRRRTRRKTQPAVLYGRGVGGTSDALLGELLALPRDRLQGSEREGHARRAPASPTGRSRIRISSRTTRRSIGKSASPARRVRIDPPRSRPYPMPPHPPKSTGMLLETGARKLGYEPFPAPMAIASKPYEGRSACVQCGFCLGFGCEVRAKSSSLVTMIPKAVATGRCEIRPNSYVRKIETDARGRGDGREVLRRRQKGDLSARESRRRVRERRRDAAAVAELEVQPVSARAGQLERRRRQVSDVQRRRVRQSACSSTRSTATRASSPRASCGISYELDRSSGSSAAADSISASTRRRSASRCSDLPPKSPRWGSAYKALLAHNYNRTVFCYGHTTSLPVETNSISLDPTVKDDWGVPAIRMTYQDHPQDLKLYKYLRRPRGRTAQGGRRGSDVAAGGREPGIQRPPARHVPHGERPEDVGGRQVQSRRTT